MMDDILWSLELAFEILHNYFAYYFGGRGTVRLGFNPSQQGRNSRKNTVAVGQEIGIAEVESGHEERALWSEGARDRNVD